jgi:hypothetical protein
MKPIQASRTNLKLMPTQMAATSPPSSLASHCLSGQPIPTCHVLTGLPSQQEAKQFNALLGDLLRECN